MIPALAQLLARIDLGEAMRRRAVQEAIGDALPYVWRRRADLFDWARPRPTDWPGRATAEDLRDADDRCRLAALACRQRAALLEAGWLDG